MNNNIKRAGRTAISSVLILGLVLGNGSFAEAKKVNKNESVYVTADASGSVQKITVADWLQDSGIVNGALKDSSNLTDITNVKGDETFSQTGGDLEWAMAGSDIYYQGQSSEKLPVDVTITYTLDGQETSVSDMLGKSGKVTIHVAYTNHSKTKKKIQGELTDIYTPFVMLTGMILSSDTFSNVSIDNGKVINDGSNQIVIGLGTPGLAESLNLDKEYADQLTSEFTVTADATDFEMGNTFTFATPSILNELNVDEIDDLEELEDKLDSLTDAAVDLADGTGKLSGNMETFSEKMEELESSVKEFNKDGVTKLTKGINTMAAGGNKLAKGVKTYVSGADTLAIGTKKYVTGAAVITKGNTALYEKVKDLPGQITEFSTGLMAYTGAVDALGSEENVSALKNGAASVAEGIGTVNDGLVKLKESYAKNVALMEALKASLDSITDESVKETQEALLKQMEAVTDSQKKTVEELEAGTSDTSDLKTGADTVSASVDKVMDTLLTLSGKSANITDAAKNLEKNIPELVKNIKKLSAGGKKLSANEKKLLSGAKSLTKAGKTMNKSVKKVSTGMKTLQKGGKSLKGASVKLVKGVTKLTAAGGKLSDGALDLDEGMNKFNRKGILKLNRLYDNDVQDALDRLEAIIDVGKEYKSFSGLNASMNGEVKFIIETEAAKKPE